MLKVRLKMSYGNWIQLLYSNNCLLHYTRGMHSFSISAHWSLEHGQPADWEWSIYIPTHPILKGNFNFTQQ